MDEEKYMARCIDLASKGEDHTAPNPMVGSVIVYHDMIIGEGYHHAYGGPHAEVNAIESVKDKSLLKQSTLYVNLEPCSHHGKTPPCSDRIIKKGIKNVVIGTTDPNSLVAGKGIHKMKKAGINVKTGLLEDECYYLNRAFFTFHQNKRPYIILKWAQTIDGYMDIERSKQESPHINWITGKSLKALVHKWRASNPSILVGTITAINDNPELTVREWVGNNPLRLLVDENRIVPQNSKLFTSETETVIFCRKAGKSNENITYQTLDFDISIIPQILSYLYERDIQSLIIEGGRLMLETFMNEDSWDEIRLLIGDRFFYNGLKAPSIPPGVKTIDYVGRDRLIHILNSNNSCFESLL